MKTTPQVAAQQRVKRRNTANSWVNKHGATYIRDLLTRSHYTTQTLYTELLTTASAIEQGLASENQKTKLKHTVAAVWECTRYGWVQTAFGRPVNPTIATPGIKCRRTRVLMRFALRCGEAIAKRQANGE